MASPMRAFDPLIDFAGKWNSKLADRYLPLPELPKARYECVDGRLIVTPTEGFTNSRGEARLTRILWSAAEDAGMLVTGRINLLFEPNNWLEPDLAVLRQTPDPDEDTWIPVDLCVMAVEFMSPNNRKSDLVDKPSVYARFGVPYLMRIELVRRIGHAHIELFRLEGKVYSPVQAAIAGQRFVAAEPFDMDFDPRELLG